MGVAYDSTPLPQYPEGYLEAQAAKEEGSGEEEKSKGGKKRKRKSSGN